MFFRIHLRASKKGALIANYSELRIYDVKAANREDAQDQARRLAYNEGLEHTFIILVVVG